MFVKKSVEEIASLSDEAFKLYQVEFSASEEIKAAKLVSDIEAVSKKNEELESITKAQGLEMAKMKNDTSKADESKSLIAKAIELNSEAVKEYSSKVRDKVELISEKAITDYSNLTQTGQLDQVDNSLSKIAHKAPVLLPLFKRKSMITETYSYRDQTSAVRDAKGVAKCATGFTSLTKEETGMVRVNDVLYKDTMDICLDYASDYSFVESESRELINESMVFKIDTDLLLGTDSSTSMNSIDNVSSEFSAANAACVLTASIAVANYSDLILSMATQIFELGKQNFWRANVAVVNNCDYFKFVQSAKDTQGRYLDPRVSTVGGATYIGDILIVPSTDVVQNTLYVMDTSMGTILDRRKVSLILSTENGTNAVDGFGTLISTARLQFLVKNNNANAFMKCSDVGVAITSITAV
jgi:hypothetical protein